MTSQPHETPIDQFDKLTNKELRAEYFRLRDVYCGRMGPLANNAVDALFEAQKVHNRMSAVRDEIDARGIGLYSYPNRAKLMEV